MKICAIDSSGPVAGIAITDDDITIAEYCIQNDLKHSTTLLPMLEEVMNRTGCAPADMDAYAVSAGPGSFTGLRIGISAVKGLGIAVDRPVVAVPTLEMLAFNMYGCPDAVCPVMDARRDQVYSGIYEFETCEDRYRMRIIRGQKPVAVTELLEEIDSLERRVIFVGDGIPVFEERMTSLKNGYSVAPAHMNRQRAASLGVLAGVYLRGEGEALEGCVTDAAGLTPVYLRPSQAERHKQEVLI